VPANEKRFLMTVWEGGGNIPPQMAIARKLLARGHQVRVLGDPTVEPSVRAVGAEFSAWTRAPHRKNLDPSTDILVDWKFENMRAAFEHMLDEFVAGPAHLFVEDTAEELDRRPVDAMLVDYLLAGPLLVAEARRIPRAVVMHNIYVRPAKGIPPFGPGFEPAKNVLGRARDALFGLAIDRLWKRGLSPINRTRASLGLTPIQDLFALYDFADAVLVLTSRSFDFATHELPTNVHYVGPQLDDPAWVAPWTSPWSKDDRRPLVLVSLSSTYQNQLPILRKLVTALGSLDVRGLVTVGPAMNPRELSPPENVAVVQSAPHGSVLQEASACVTHCGHGTTMRALIAGVPLVCIPMGRDQNDTAARVTARGAGVRFATTASAGAYRDGIRRVLENRGFRDAARALGSAISEEQDSERVTIELEALATAHS